MGSTYFSKRIPERTAVRNERSRPKTFKTEEKAKEYAEKHKIAKYTITRLSGHKFRIEQ